MYMSVSPPTTIFFLSMLLGVCFGIFWDVNRVLKKLIKSSTKKFVFSLDIIFSVIVCILTITFFYFFTYAGFRLFVLIGALLGFILYYCTIEKPIYYILHIIIGFIIKIIFKILNFAKIIGNKLKFILEFIVKYFKNKTKNIKINKANKTNKDKIAEEYIMKKLGKFIKKNKM